MAVGGGVGNKPPPVVKKRDVDAREGGEEGQGLGVVVHLHGVRKAATWVRSHDAVRERGQLDPPEQELLRSLVMVVEDFPGPLRDDGEAANIRVGERVSCETSGKHASEGAFKAIFLVPAHELVAHPEQGRCFRAVQRRTPREEDNVGRSSTRDVIALLNGLRRQRRPLLGVGVVVGCGIAAAEEHRVEWQVLAEVVHPAVNAAAAAEFAVSGGVAAQHVFLDDLLRPLPSRGVRGFVPLVCVYTILRHCKERTS